VTVTAATPGQISLAVWRVFDVSVRVRGIATTPPASAGPAALSAPEVSCMVSTDWGPYSTATFSLEVTHDRGGYFSLVANCLNADGLYLHNRDMGSAPRVDQVLREDTRGLLFASSSAFVSTISHLFCAESVGALCTVLCLDLQ
jgi:hypothetical protein